MLRYKTETRPGLDALYYIQPGNGAGQFLQPRSPHGAKHSRTTSSLMARQNLNCLCSASTFYLSFMGKYRNRTRYGNSKTITATYWAADRRESI